MSMYLFRDWVNDLETMRPSRLLDQHFGRVLSPEDLLSPMTLSPYRPLLHSRYYRPWRVDTSDSGSTVQCDKDKFQVNLDVQQFTPEEVKVKVVDGSIIVEAKHEEKQDEHGFISRQFVRRYVLPKGYDMKDVMSTLSSDGVLTITASKADAIEAAERVINIAQTGPHKAVQDADKKDEKK
ncbi:lethal (2) essential for life [Carabus blaptoides fortunei]